MKISQPLPNFIQGVSQQPEALRLSSHAEELINGYASPEAGLSKRPAAEFVSTLADDTNLAAKIHSFNKSENEQGYAIIKGDGTLVVKDLNGVAATVTMTAATGYINSVSTPITDLELVTVADHTFIVNRTVVPALKSDTYFDMTKAAGGYWTTAVWVRTPQLDTNYNIILSTGTGLTATYNPGTTAANAETTVIAGALNTAINGNGSPAFTSQVRGSTVYMHRSANAYDVEVNDGRGNEAMVLLHRSTNNPANLPPDAIDNYQVEITGSEATEWDDYWVEWDPTKKSWLEIPEPNRQYKIDPTTMPHVLRYVSPGQYAFETIEWNDCLAGDTITNPVPSFIGKTINDLFFYRGRLGLLTDGTIVLSEAGNLYNFWRTTTTALVDSDPIDAKVSMTNPSAMRWAVEYNDTVIFCSETAQYYIEKNVQTLTPASFAIRNTTSFKMDTSCQPVVVGERMYYTRQRALHTSLHDFSPSQGISGQLQYSSEEVTRHCPSYILGRAIQIVGNGAGDTIAIVTNQSDEYVYIFQSSYNQGSLIQAALHKWQFAPIDSVLSMESIGSAFYLLFSRTDGVHLEKIDLSPKAVDTAMTVKVLLDHRFDETTVASEVYSSSTELTTITLPIHDKHGASQATTGGYPYVVYARGGSTLGKPGQLIASTVTQQYPLVLTIAGDWTADNYYVGKNYLFDLTLSRIVLRDKTTAAPLTGGRLQVAKIALNYGDTAYFRAEVTPLARDTYTYAFTGQVLATSQATIGSVPLQDGIFRFPVKSKAENVTVHIKSDAPLPLKLLNGDWYGQYGNQSVNVTRRV